MAVWSEDSTSFSFVRGQVRWDLQNRGGSMTTPAAASLCGAATVFVVQDVLRAVEHYRDVLGFHTEFTYGEPTFYAGAERDGVVIHLQAASETKRLPGHGPSISLSRMLTRSTRS